MAEFFDMGGYAAFVWPSWAIAVAVILGITIISINHDRKIKAALSKLDHAAATTSPQDREKN